MANTGGRGAASDAAVSTDPGKPGLTAEEVRTADIAAASRAVEKAETQLTAAKEALANAKKGMN